MKRNLTLRRETLSDLSADDLAGVAAGAASINVLRDCPTVTTVLTFLTCDPRYCPYSFPVC